MTLASMPPMTTDTSDDDEIVFKMVKPTTPAIDKLKPAKTPKSKAILAPVLHEANITSVVLEVPTATASAQAIPESLVSAKKQKTTTMSIAEPNSTAVTTVISETIEPAHVAMSSRKQKAASFAAVAVTDVLSVPINTLLPEVSAKKQKTSKPADPESLPPVIVADTTPAAVTATPKIVKTVTSSLAIFQAATPKSNIAVVAPVVASAVKIPVPVSQTPTPKLPVTVPITSPVSTSPETIQVFTIPLPVVESVFILFIVLYLIFAGMKIGSQSFLKSIYLILCVLQQKYQMVVFFVCWFL